jgi:hypothetical protein
MSGDDILSKTSLYALRAAVFNGEILTKRRLKCQNNCTGGI